jgi:quercetin dioxygenase-like cupin family protein
MELTVGDETYRMIPGQIVTIPSDVPHSGRAITDCEIMDVFCPVREDYK